MKQYIKDNKIVNTSYPIELNGMLVINATDEMLLENGYTEYIAPEPEPHIETEEEKELRYKSRVSELIREKYTIDDEFALHRQKDSKVEEYTAYNTYCEECKRIAREEIYVTEE